MKRIPLLLALLFALPSYGATIKGHITDAKGEALGFATVFLKGTTIGTTANAAGDYQLTVDAGTYTIVCQMIGYTQHTKPVTVDINETKTINFSLSDQALNIREVTVKANGEDPAYPIIRKAIKKRSYHLKQFKTFQTGVYLKGVLRTRNAPNQIFGVKIDGDDKGQLGMDSNGKGVLYLCEEEADYFQQLPDKERTVIHSVRESGDPHGTGFSQMPTVISFYENNIDLGTELTPRGLVSPIADGAMNYYKYHLEGEFIENDRTIFQISVTPKRLYEPLFNGTIYIVDNDFAIHSLSLGSNGKQGLELIDTLVMKQLYLPLANDQWVIKTQVYYPTINILGFGITGNFVTVYDKQKVNEVLPDSIFGKKVISSYDRTANKKDTSYWTDKRPVPLEQDESRDYIKKDSVRTVTSDPHYVDSVRRKNNHVSFSDIILGGFTINGKEYKQSFTVDGLLFSFNYNTVEGLNFSPRFSYSRRLDSISTLSARTALRYGYSNSHFNGIASVTYSRRDPYWRGRNWRLKAEAGKYVFQFNPHNPVNELYNTFATLASRKNYLKIYERWNYGLTFNRNYGNGLRWNAGVNYQQRLPLENTTDFTWAKDGVNGFTENSMRDVYASDSFVQHDAFILKAGISFQPGVNYTLYPDYKQPSFGNWPVFMLTYVKGIPNVANSVVDYDKWRFDVNGSFRLRLFGRVDYNIAAGGFLSDKYVGLPDLQHLDGNQFPLATPYLQSFQLMPYYQYSNHENIYGEAHIEYNLAGLITNKIPLLRQAKWYFILGGNAWYAGQDKYYAEAFVSVDNLGYKLFRFLRVDLVQSWDGMGNMNYGFRLGLRSGGVVNIRTDRTDGEW